MAQAKSLQFPGLVILLYQCNFIHGLVEFCADGLIHRVTTKECSSGAIYSAKSPIKCLYINQGHGLAEMEIIVKDSCNKSANLSVIVNNQLNEYFYPGALKGNELIINITNPGQESSKDDVYTIAPEEVNSCYLKNCSLFKTIKNIEEKVFESRNDKSDVKEVNYTMMFQMLKYMVNNEDFFDEGKNQTSDKSSTDLRVIKLLRKSMTIASSVCHPFVKMEFLEQVLKAFRFFSNSLTNFVTDIGNKQYKRINSALQKCLDNVPNFRLSGISCGIKNEVKSIWFKDFEWPYWEQARSFIWKEYNPIIEAAWAVIDFTHGYCFKNFFNDLNYHHMYAVAMESLFNKKDVVNVWYDAFSDDEEYLNLESDPAVFGWNYVFKTHRLNMTLRNLDACVIGGYYGSNLTYRLLRPEISTSSTDDPGRWIPRKDNFASELQNVPRVIIEEFSSYIMPKHWQEYDQSNGFRSLADVSDNAVCSATQNQFNQEIYHLNYNCSK